jgi:drug/metabolite transporter (DMT)-like permease
MPPDTLLGFALALGATVGWSALDALRKRLATDLSGPTVLLGLSLPQVPIHVGVAVANGSPRIDGTFLLLVALGAALTIAGNLCFVRAVRVAPLSLTVPYLSLTPVVTSLGGALVLAQVPGPLGLVGMVVIAGGALGLHGSLRELLRSTGTAYMLLVALAFALANVVDRLAVVRASEPAYAACLTGVIGATLLALPAVRRELARERHTWPWLLLAALSAAVALLLQLFAYRHVYVAYVDAVKRGGGNLLAIVAGRLLFAEPHAARRLTAALCMSLGVALVLLAG